MRIERLIAEGVHGYLSFDIRFNPRLSFLTGLNGDGKTTALELASSLLGPNLEYLGATEFRTAEVILSGKGNPITVRASRNDNGLQISISTLEGTADVSPSELELIINARREGESSSPVIRKFQQNSIIQAISELVNPVLLGIDRRPFSGKSTVAEYEDARRRDQWMRRMLLQKGLQVDRYPASLREAFSLVVVKMQEIRATLADLDEKLRNDIFERAFELPDFTLSRVAPTTARLKDYQSKLQKIQQVANEVSLPMQRTGPKIEAYIESVTKIVHGFERQTIKRRPKGQMLDAEENEALVQWYLVQPQVDQIEGHLDLLTKYVDERAELLDPITQLKNLVDSFLEQTGKELIVERIGVPAIKITATGQTRDLASLSSGERQVMSILSQLTLNPELESSGILMVDEPELSLHLAWQEKFVEAILEANSSVQFILATHSPAIVLDRDDACIDLR